MTDTTFLQVPFLQSAIKQPEIIENEAKVIFDASIAGQLTLAMTANTDYTLDDTSLTYPQEWQYRIIIVPATAHTGVVNVVVPDGKTMNYVLNNSSGSGNNIVLKTATGSGVSVPDGSVYQMYSDGVDVIRIT